MKPTLLLFVEFSIDDEIMGRKVPTFQRISRDGHFLYADPDWSHPDFPYGLSLFDPEHNVAAVLGLNYFGELKKKH